MVCVMIPLSIPVFIYLPLKRKGRTIKEDDEPYFREQLSEMFEESYRPNFFWWESYRLMERCLTAAIVTFVINPVKRTIILSPFFVMFLMFRYVFDPYKQSLKLVKMLDILSSAFLCLLVVINMFRADVYTHNLPFQFPVDEVSTIAYYLELIFSPLWFLIIWFMMKPIFGYCLPKFKKKSH